MFGCFIRALHSNGASQHLLNIYSNAGLIIFLSQNLICTNKEQNCNDAASGKKNYINYLFSSHIKSLYTRHLLIGWR